MDFLKLNELDKAEREFRYAIELDEQFAPAHLGLAILYYKNKQFITAEHHIDQSLKLHNNLPEAYLIKGKVLFQKEAYIRALDFLNQAAAGFEDNVDKNRSGLQAEIFLWRGLCLKNLNNYSLAAIDMANVLKLDPDNQPAIQAMDEIRNFNEMTIGLEESIKEIVLKKEISRADWAALLVHTLSKRYILKKIAINNQINLKDIHKNESIRKAIQCNLVNYYPDGEFKPDLDLSWAEILMSLNNIIGFLSVDNNSKFTQTQIKDLHHFHPLYDTAVKAQSLGIFNKMSQKFYLMSGSVKGMDAMQVIKNLNQVLLREYTD